MPGACEGPDEALEPCIPDSTLRKALYWGLASILAAGFCVGCFFLYTKTDVLEKGINATKGTGPWAGLVLSCMVFGFSLPVPGHLTFVLATGFILGTWYGCAVMIAASFAGAAACFFGCRFLFRDWTQEKAKGIKMFDAFNYLCESKGLRMVMLVRFIPAPFGIWNGIMSVMNVSTRDYMIATFVDLLLYTPHVYIASECRSVVELLAGEPVDVTTSQKIASAVGIAISAIATISVMVWTTIEIRRHGREASLALKERKRAEAAGRTLLATGALRSDDVEAAVPPGAPPAASAPASAPSSGATSPTISMKHTYA
eukprot:tig00000058_g742.t1